MKMVKKSDAREIAEACDQLATKALNWKSRALAAEMRAADMSEAIGRLYPALSHGDDMHRAWLKAAIEAHFAGEPVPPAVGGSRKEKLIAQLADALRLARTFMVDFEGLPEAEADSPLMVVDAALAQAIEARSGETGTGSTEGESAVRQDAPEPPTEPPSPTIQGDSNV